MMPQIYYSHIPDVHIPERSIFTHLFGSNFDPQLPAYIDAPTGQTLSRADVRIQCLQLAWGLQNILYQKRSSTIAIFSPNSIAWPVVLLGSIAAGLRVTTVNSAYTPRELRHQLEDSRAYYIFVHPSLLNNTSEALRLMGVSDVEIKERIIQAAPAHSAVPGWRSMDELFGKGQLTREEPFDGAAAHETVLLCYSSGTTSKSKGVELSHHNVISVLCIVTPQIAYLSPIGAVMLSVLPFYHIYGLVKLVLNPFYRGAPQVVMSHFDPDAFCANVERYKVTVSLVVPPILVVLANHPAPEKYNMSSLKILFSGAAPLGEGLSLAVHARLRRLGADVMLPQGWGLTETSPTCIMQHETEWQRHAGSIGKLLPNLQARLVLDDGVTDAPMGEAGEIWIKGPNVMKGYLNNPEATQDAITSDRWFKTGDIAVVDSEGNFRIVDRKKELIKYKGFQVPPAELEGVLLTHPRVVDAGVIGVFSEAEATEYPRAYIVPRGGVASLRTSADREALGQEIQAWIRTKVARHKYLRGGVVAVDTIPKSAAGKILRRELRELAKEDLQVTGSVKAKL
ncbi:AMP binding protein [Gautieria morchelliformis]|nr:AMP binding protein [Gautieria morchelliformis]